MREYKLALNGNNYAVTIVSVSDDEVVAEVNGETHTVSIQEIKNLSGAKGLIAPPQPAASPVSAPAILPVASSAMAKVGMIVSPIPGHILEVCVTVGDQVLAGQKVLVLEAMKLENAITTDGAGVVKKVMVTAGDAVTHGQNMIEIG